MENETKFGLILFYTILFLALFFSLIIVFIIKSRKKILIKELEKKDLEIKFQKQVLKAIIDSQEEERKRIAQDLHDDISSKLIGISLNLHLLKSEKTSKEDKTEITQKLIEINQRTIENSRLIAHHLFPPVLEKFGLNAAVEELTQDYNKSKLVNVKYTNKIDFETTSINNKLQIFRIIQELINNSIKHGKATEIHIDLLTKNSINQCNYCDNGIGIDKKNKLTKGLGFYNIESRIENLNGVFKINHQEKNGFNFWFKFDL